MKKIIKKLIGQLETDELDFQFYNDFGVTYGGDELDIIRNKIGYSDGYVINIDLFQSYIDKLKSMGANYLSLDYHCDHITYLIDGYEVREANQEEIDEKNEKLEKFREEKKQAEIKRLEIQLKQLKS